MAEWHGGRADGQDAGFVYDEAPDRGWQEGKKDFTDKVTYYKWHGFKKKKAKDDYALQS